MFEGRVRRIAVEVRHDSRGALLPIDFADVPFDVRRAFVVTAPDGVTRGGHAHLEGRQVLVRVRGVIDVDLRRGDERLVLTLDEQEPALIVEPLVWASQTYRGADAALVVFCDTAFDPADYVHDVPGATDVGVGRAGADGLE